LQARAKSVRRAVTCGDSGSRVSGCAMEGERRASLYPDAYRRRLGITYTWPPECGSST
jgi:hypothetical protein